MGFDAHDPSVQLISGICEGKERPIFNYCKKSVLRPTDKISTAGWAGTVLLELGMVITVEPGICVFEQ